MTEMIMYKHNNKFMSLNVQGIIFIRHWCSIKTCKSLITLNEKIIVHNQKTTIASTLDHVK